MTRQKDTEQRGKKRYRQTTKKKEWKEEAIKKVVTQTDRKKL